MLKNLFAGMRNSVTGQSPEEAESVAPRGAYSLERLKQLADYFPIGKKLRYIPEFKDEIVFETLIVAYCVNGHYLYSWDAIELDAEGCPVGFLVGEGGERLPIAKMHRFQLLVPDTTELENRLDYDRRALLGRGRQFAAGNVISLISNVAGRGVATLDTEVAQQTLLKDGPYAHAKMVLLDPDFATIAVTDQRGRTRSKTCVPVTVTVAGQLRGPCTIVDISDAAVRIRVRDDEALRALKRGDEVTLDFDFGDAERAYTLKGAVVRRSAETCVVSLGAFFRDGRFLAFEAFDLLELKAGLLNYGK